MSSAVNHFVWSADPILLHLGPFQLRWYGLFFVGSFFIGMALLRWIFRREKIPADDLDNLLLLSLLGTVIGARLMHCLAYQPDYYLSHPLEILKVWKGGLASHGGMLGMMVVLYGYARTHGLSYIWLLSRLTLPGMIVAASVRIGNFFNSEILGLPTDVPWAVIFSRIDALPRHPVQLYEAISYLLIFVVLLLIYLRTRPAFSARILPGVFLVLLFGSRFALEYFKTRQADYTTSLPWTTGQLLSLPMILLGIVWIAWAVMRREPTTGNR
jgi:prolipoprotein diacylglyceryl transferase